MVLTWFIAGVLVGAIAALLATRAGAHIASAVAGRRSYLLVATLVVTLAAGAAIIYSLVNSRERMHATGPTVSTGSGGTAVAMDAAVTGLEGRLARGGGADADWTLLAQAYDFLGRSEDAQRARNHLLRSDAGAAIAPLSVATLSAAAASLEPGRTLQDSSGRTAATHAAPATPKDASQNWLSIADERRAQRDFAGARSAYEKAIENKQMTAQSWADYADAIASLPGQSLGGPAAAAIDQALAMDPLNTKALWLKASQAHEQHRYSEALSWWAKLSNALPADSEDRRIIAANISEDRSLAGTAAASTQIAATSGSAPVAISGSVSVAARYADRISPNATVFIYAKSVDSPGPPIAVFRTSAASWPVSFQLDDSRAMLPGRKLSQFDKIVVEARISRSGQAAPTSGDLYTTSPVLHPADGKKLALIIDHVIG